MTAIDFDKLLAIASDTIDNFGRAATLRTFDGGDADAAVTAIITDYPSRSRFGTLILPDDRRAIIAAKVGVPTPDPERHVLILDGMKFQIVSTRPLNPSGVILYFDCQVRQ